MAVAGCDGIKGSSVFGFSVTVSFLGLCVPFKNYHIDITSVRQYEDYSKAECGSGTHLRSRMWFRTSNG